MAAAAGENWWRKVLATGLLSFAALGLAGCDDPGSSGEEGVEQESPTGGGEASVDDDATTEGESPREGEGPAEQDVEQGEGS